MFNWKSRSWFTRISIYLYLIGIVVFISISFINYSLLVGWLIGAISSLITYMTIQMTFANKDHELFGSISSLFRSFINVLIQTGLLIGIISINQSIHGNTIISGGIDGVMSPINIFTYVAGMTVTMWTVLGIYIERK